MLLPAGVMDEMELEITRSCKYSQALLMMGEDIARNMQSSLGINK
jgi:hypothetical protein